MKLPQNKTPLVFGLVLTCAVFFGYFKDTLSEATQNYFQKKELISGIDDSVTKNPPLKQQPQPQTLDQFYPPPKIKSPFPSGPTKQITKDMPEEKAPDQTSDNPLTYQESFAASMNSTQHGEIQENQKAQRNLYFEKLSQQLRDLQGQQNEEDPGNNDLSAPVPSTLPYNQMLNQPNEEFYNQEEEQENLSEEDQMVIDNAIDDFVRN